MSTPAGDQRAALRRHIQNYLGALSDDPVTAPLREAFAAERARLGSEAAIELAIVPPDLDREHTLLITVGMSDAPMAVPREVQGNNPELYRHAELVLGLAEDWPLATETWPATLLSRLAQLPERHSTWLGAGHTVPNGDPPLPYAGGSELCCALIAPTFEVDEGFKQLRLLPAKKGADGLIPGVLIQFYGVIPIFQEEMDLKLSQGAEELLDRLETYRVTEVLTPSRRNVAKRRKLWPF
ncbi:MAG: suppressor of fused domain protein [Polyangiaceae bacterium]|nr:suppressor of fused domain protein [Polyangiaceae bacterium]MCW5792625.1 suppressor of fused domain protein [Polyangiaceae bacterium]